MDSRERQRQAVTILVDSLVSFYALEPVIRELGKRGLDLYLFAPSSILVRIRDLLVDVAIDFRELDAIAARSRRWLYVHRFLRQMLTRPNFSFQYRLLSDPRQYPGDWRYRWTARLARMSPGIRHDRINRVLKAMISIVVRSPFPSSSVLAASRNMFPHLLCARGLKVTTILESWDHPVKWPVGHTSRLVFTWNDPLAQDWRNFQGDQEVYAAYPFKLRYWIEKRIENRSIGKRRVVVYAAGTSSMSYINNLYQDELRVIEAVCQACVAAGWELVIKPKPNGKIGDFDRFVARYSNVRIGGYRDASSPSDYYLDDDYNRQRERELEEADLLINALTTFALDAAVAGVPCLQLDLRGCPEYKGVAEGQTNHHIARYLLADKQSCLVASSGMLVEQLREFLRNPDERPERARDRLREWLRSSRSCAEVVRSIADRLLEVTL